MAIAEAGGRGLRGCRRGVDRLDCCQRRHGCLQALEEQASRSRFRDHHGPDHPDRGLWYRRKKVQRLIDRLEELDDVQDVYSTMDMTDEVIAALEEE